MLGQQNKRKIILFFHVSIGDDCDTPAGHAEDLLIEDCWLSSLVVGTCPTVSSQLQAHLSQLSERCYPYSTSFQYVNKLSDTSLT